MDQVTLDNDELLVAKYPAILYQVDDMSTFNITHDIL